MKGAADDGSRVVPPYTALASVYDLVMDHVDYEEWAEYVRSLLTDLNCDPKSVLELGCGTGSFAMEFVRKVKCRYLATDASPEMIHVARQKAALFGTQVVFEVGDFSRLESTLESSGAYDLVLLLYDGINYLLNPDEIEGALRRIRSAMLPDGLFVFDQSTPANSINNAVFFEDHGEEGPSSYVRQSYFDSDSGLHHTTFELVIEGKRFREEHVQRAYSMEFMDECIAGAGFAVVASFEDFSRRDASSPESERIQWVLRPA